MKKVLFVLSLMFGIICNVSAQVKDVCKYDSLSDEIKEDSLDKYIGQSIYTSKDNDNLGFLRFYKNLKGETYYAKFKGDPFSLLGIDYKIFDCLTNRMFKIKDSGKTVSGKKYIQLVDDNNETIYYIFDQNIRNLHIPFLLYGYYIKMKNMLQGYKCYVSYNNYRTCDSIFIDRGYLGPEVRVKYSTGEIEYASPYIIRNCIYQKKHDDLQRKILEDQIKEADERILNVKKYGLVRVGMRRAIVLKVCGYPDKINTTTTRYGKSEQFIYIDRQYIYIDNGRVSAIQNYQ